MLRAAKRGVWFACGVLCYTVAMLGFIAFNPNPWAFAWLLAFAVPASAFFTNALFR